LPSVRRFALRIHLISKPAGKVLLSTQKPFGRRRIIWVAAVAQPVERVLGKDEVMGSNPISSYVQVSQGAAAARAGAGLCILMLE
jgi:hypothetical protein